MKNVQHSTPGLTTARLETLADGIFAIAMTLLVLNLSIPHLAHENAGNLLPGILFGQINDLLSYALSFLLLAQFWILHHRQFHYIKHTDNVHLWINVVLFMFVTLMPFTTSLIAFYADLRYTNIIFHINILVLGILFYGAWAYATGYHRLVDKALSYPEIESGKRKYLIIPVIALMAILCAYFSPLWSPSVYLLIPFVLMMLAKH